MNSGLLKNFINNAPAQPGVYVFKKESQELYVGKASNLKNRLRSYLKTGDVRIRKMISLADTVGFQVTESDIEALILESKLIKNIRPAFNVSMRDDKQYFFVGFTKENFPKIFLTHQPHRHELKRADNEPQKTKGQKSKFTIHNSSEFIGPFTDGTAIKTALKYLRKVFPYCTCRRPHNSLCLNYHIGKCPGFCCLKQPPAGITQSAVYKKNIRALKEVLRGNKKTLIKKLAMEMHGLAKNGKLEEAITTREKIESLERIFRHASVVREHRSENESLKKLAKILKLKKPPFRIEGYDISNIQGTNATGSMVVFEDGSPAKNHYRKFRIKTKSTPDDTFMLSEMLQRRFNHPEWKFPDLILMDGGKGQLNTAKQIVKILDFKIPIISLAKGKDEIFSTSLENPVPMSELPPNVRNLIKNIDAEAHRFAINYYRKLHAKKISTGGSNIEF